MSELGLILPQIMADYSDTHLDLLSAISGFFIKETAASSITAVQGFIERLKQNFDLTVVTLNYDDLIDRTGDWFDGFVSADDDPPADWERFDPTCFRTKILSAPAALLHLHGSVRFGLSPWHLSPRNWPQIVRYQSAERALASVQPSEKAPGGPVPIISGYNKERWMTRYAMPFGYYYNAFVNAACESPLWLIAGYGANDRHVNGWVTESMRIHGANSRIVIIDRSEGLPLWHSLDWSDQPGSRMQMYTGAKGDFPPNNNTAEEILSFLAS